MNILMTIHHGLDGNAGAPGVTLRLAEEFRRLDHRVSVLSFDDLPSSIPARARPVVFPLYIARRLSRQGRMPDVFDASSGDAWLGDAARSRPGRPLLVCRSHGLEHTAHLQYVEEARRGTRHLSWKYPLYHGGYRLWEVTQSLRRADLVLLLNHADLDYAADQLGVVRDRLRLVQNGLPEAFLGLPFQPAPAGEVRIAQVGSYISRKGIAYGARALDAILSRHRNVQVHFLGTGVEAEQVHADFSASSRARVLVTPRYDNAQLPAMLGSCQVNLFPTLYEGFSVALLEAMACGLATVSTTAPGPSMVIRDGHNGLLVPPADAGALERALESLILAPERLERLRRTAHADAQRYAWSRIARSQVGLFEEFLRRKHSTEPSHDRRH